MAIPGVEIAMVFACSQDGDNLFTSWHQRRLFNRWEF